MEAKVEQAIVTTAVCTAFAAIAYGFREWMRLSTLREKQAALSLASEVIVSVVFVGFVAGVWFVVSPAAAVSAFLGPAALIVGKHIAAFTQHLLYLWWERHLRVGVDAHVGAAIESQEEHRDWHGN